MAEHETFAFSCHRSSCELMVPGPRASLRLGVQLMQNLLVQIAGIQMVTGRYKEVSAHAKGGGLRQLPKDKG